MPISKEEIEKRGMAIFKKFHDGCASYEWDEVLAVAKREYDICLKRGFGAIMNCLPGDPGFYIEGGKSQ
ncbi:MAG: hypothetical protein WC455_29765 [Dehalococcoidia bacterium]|jgi:hypothetical protein